MQLPTAIFVSSIEHRKVYYFKSCHIKNSSEPHYFVCVGFESENVMMLCCFTSQIQKRIDFIESRRLSYTTLVIIDPNKTAVLPKECCVNCNDYYIHTKEEFAEMYAKGEIEYKGDLEDDYYHQICLGIEASELIEEDQKLKVIRLDE